MIKKTLKFIGYTLLSIIAFVGVYALAVWLLPKIAVNKTATGKAPNEITIYIKSNGVHTDIVVPMHNSWEDWSKIVPYANTDSKDTTFQYAAFGWGDKGFYLETPNWSDLKFSVAFKAMFHLGTSAMHVTFYKQMILGEKCKSMNISHEQYLKLINYIKSTLKYDAQGKTIQIITHNDGYGTDDAFYESNGTYDLFHTCNTWANRALKSCDQRACLWTALDKGIFKLYE